MKDIIDGAAAFLAGVGALNWGLLQWFKFDLAQSLLGAANAVWAYWLIGISGGYMLLKLFGVFKK